MRTSQIFSVDKKFLNNRKAIFGNNNEAQVYYDLANQMFKIFSSKLIAFGTGSTNHSLGGGDSYIPGRLEVDSNAYFDSYVSVAAYRSMDFGTGIYLYSGADQTLTTLFNRLIIAPRDFRTKNFGHGAQANPMVFFHSATDPDIDNTQYGYIGHNQEDFIFGAGMGRVRGMVGFRYRTADVNVSTYTVAYYDEILNVSYTTTGAVSITIPDGTNDPNINLCKAGYRFLIIDSGGNASVNNITISTEGTKTINGSTSVVINQNYGFLEIISDGNNFYAR